MTSAIRLLTKAEWDSAIAGLEDAQFHQRGAYAEMAAAAAGAKVEFAQLGDAAFAAVRVKRIPGTGTGIAYVHRGPCTGAFDAGRWAEAVDHLVSHYVQKMGLVLRLSPPAYDGLAGEALDGVLRARGFSHGKTPPYRSILIDLSPPLETLRKNLAGKWRTDLARGERSAVRIERSDAPEDILRLSALLDTLAEHKGFSVAQGPDFFAEVARRAGAGERIAIHLAWHEERLVGGHIGAFSGDTAVYLLGANNAEGRDVRASFLLQWAVLTHAKESGMHYYDLGGIDADENPDVFRFKSRMGGREIAVPAGYELAPSGIAAALVNGAERAVKLLRTLKG